jgi:hypothetical protein
MNTITIWLLREKHQRPPWREALLTTNDAPAQALRDLNLSLIAVRERANRLKENCSAGQGKACSTRSNPLNLLSVQRNLQSQSP